MNGNFISAKDCAAFIVRHAAASAGCEGITNLQLQKLLYLAQVARLREHGLPLFADDVYAWRYGPVIPSVYRTYSYFGADPIVAAPERGVKLPPDADDALHADDSDMALLASVCDEWCGRPAWELVAECRRVGSPWDVIWDDGKGNGCVIPIDVMRSSASAIS